eukprot:gb/GFBE01026275.1/.p1 GENE.gb/GFBE01026275.1/~~gb/GFBE01026275.1/.p1  ORF type:complete len:309 (+),score=77.89 gb/GFBE01026275.1/:1-927(+)
MLPQEESIAAQAGGVVHFLVVAEAESKEAEEEITEHRWEGHCELHSPLRALASAWASKHLVPVSAVALEDEHGTRLDLSKPPTAYGWKVAQQVILVCFPDEEEFMDAQSLQERHQDSAAPAAASSSSASTSSSARVSPAASAMQGVQQIAAEEARGQKREATSQEEEEGSKRSRSAAASPQAVAARSDSAKGSKSTAQANETAKSKGGKTEPAAKAATAPKPKKAEGGTKKAEGNQKKAEGFGPNAGEPPGPDEPIEFSQTNPKKAGGSSWDRYEAYKKANTVKEALDLGAAKGDIAYDWKRGFFKRK